MNTDLILGKDGIKKVMDIVIDKMTYDRTVAFMAEMPKISESDDEEDVTILDRILWMVRWAYITGYYDALDVYDTAMSDEELNADTLSQKVETMTDDEYCEVVRRISGQLGISGERMAPAPRRIPNPSPVTDLHGDGSQADKTGIDSMTIEQQREWLVSKMSTLSLEELEGLKRAIDAMSSDDDEAFYQCWREKLDEYETIPDKLLNNEFVKRYLAEKSSKQLCDAVVKVDTQEAS